MIKGYLETVLDGWVHGWVCDIRDPDSDLFVEIWLGEQEPYTTVRANMFREDLRATGYGSGHSGFRVWVPDMVREHGGELSVRVAGSGEILPGIEDAASGIFQRVHTALIARGLLSGAQANGPADKFAPCCFEGGIVAIKGARIDVATNVPADHACPVLAVGNTIAWRSPETDFMLQPEPGRHYHRFYLSGVPEKADLALSLVSKDGAFLVERRQIETPALELSALAQLDRAARLARDREAVAVVCWGATGPQALRAAALQGAVSRSRPCVLFLLQDDCAEGAGVAPELLARDCAVVTVPWSDRLTWFDLFGQMQIAFDTVWMSGTHLRTFMLAGAVCNAESRLMQDCAERIPAGSHDRTESEGLLALLQQQVVLQTAATPELAEMFGARLVLPEGDGAEQAVMAAQDGQLRSKGCAFSALAQKEHWIARRSMPEPALLLVWKQQDSAMYGRRIDQIARSYRRAHPDRKVCVLEISSSETEGLYSKVLPYASELTAIRHINLFKQHGTLPDPDGIDYRQLHIEQPEQIHQALFRFLIAERLMPDNTVIVLFPNILHIERTFDLLRPYPVIADIVDNQMAWAPNASKPALLSQLLSVLHIAECCIFNSEKNRGYLEAAGLLKGKSSMLLPNWYQMPKGVCLPDHRSAEHFDLVYSGNMNERVDWQLLREVIEIDPRLRLHLIGEGRLAREQLSGLLEHERVIYYGPRNEVQTLELLAQADLAVIAHLHDKVSAYMNPIKVLMYRAADLPVLSTQVPGIQEAPGLTIAPDKERFCAYLKSALDEPRNNTCALSPAQSENARRYIETIDALRQAHWDRFR